MNGRLYSQSQGNTGGRKRGREGKGVDIQKLKEKRNDAVEGWDGNKPVV